MPQHIKPIVWTIAGSDSGGGAGIQADLHTFKALECHGCSIISCITAQNSIAVLAYENTSIPLFINQLDCLLTDMSPHVIKIGLIADDKLVKALTQWLEIHKKNYHFQVIADPVFSSSTGCDFLQPSLIQQWQQLLPLLDLITPNLAELFLISSLSNNPFHPHSGDKLSIEQQASILLNLGVKAVLVTGGHSNSNIDIIDTLYQSQQVPLTIQNKRQNTRHNHGTGCVLSSSIAAALAHDYTLVDAIIIGNAVVQQALTAAYATGSGAGSLYLSGWPSNLNHFPRLNNATSSKPTVGFAAMPTVIGVYPILDNIQWLKRLVPLGLDTVQLRIKQAAHDNIEQQIIAAIEFAKQQKLKLFINDYWQFAVKHGAYGVHLGQEDVLSADLIAIQNAGLRLGISTHSYQELLNAIQLKPSYIALGHIFPTSTKQMPSLPQGLSKLSRYRQLCQHIPTVAIGGINAARFKSVIKSGVNGIAVVTAITADANPEHAFTALKQQFEQHHLDDFVNSSVNSYVNSHLNNNANKDLSQYAKHHPNHD